MSNPPDAPAGPRSALPFRPRLADHAALRRQLVDGRELILIHDTHTDEVIEIDERALALLRCADGTRDIGGVVLAAVHAGLFRRSSEIEQLLSGLVERSLLTDGIPAPERQRPIPTGEQAQRLEPLPSYTLSCNGNGMCCGTYSSIPFTRREADRARALVPDVLGEDDDASRLFVPLQSSADGAVCAVTMVDGHCPYLDEDFRCRLQLAGGPEAKPHGCTIFPATFVDDGTAVRVSVAVECPCVLASIGRSDGSPLTPAGASTVLDLEPGSRVIRLPESIIVTAERTATRAELRAWSTVVATEAATLSDPLAALWSLADAARDEGLSTAAAQRALKHATAPTAAALTFSVMALAGRTKAKADATATWRSTQDRTRQLAGWLATVADRMIDPAAVTALLDEPRHVEHEQFFLRATAWGHHLVSSGVSLEQALRDRATRLLLARGLSEEIPAACADHPAAPYPLTAVEAMMRGQGLETYISG